MSDINLDKYLEEKSEQFQQILFLKEWDKVQGFYKEMEDEGWGQYVPEISQFMSEEDVLEYKKWDEKVNGSVETQMDDNS